MNDPAILFVKPQALKSADKAALRKAGVIVVEVDDPQAVKFVRAGVELSSTVLLACAAKAIKDGPSSSVQMAFATAVCEELMDGAGAPQNNP